MRERAEASLAKEFSKKEMDKDCRDRRGDMMYHFSRVGKKKTKHSGVGLDDGSTDRPITRSANDEDEDWTIDMDAANCEVSDIRRLDRYPIEQLLTQTNGSKLLLLVEVGEDNRGTEKNKYKKIAQAQNTPRKVISGREYHQVKCTVIEDTMHQMVMSGPGAKLYTQAMFEDDFHQSNAGFKVSFPGTAKETHLNWNQLVTQPSTFMCFGAPLSVARSFDNIFAGLRNMNTLHARFLCFWREFEGDAQACCSLYNAYLSRKMWIVEKNHGTTLAGRPDIKASSIFTSDKVVQFLDGFDLHCWTQLEGVLSSFQNHSEPIIRTPKMQEFIEQAPAVFGDLWKLMCDIRGVNPKLKKEESRMDDKVHSVFFELLCMARIRNRKKLKHWAMIQNIANYARGVGRTAEVLIAYFGNALSNTTRRRLWTKLIGNDKAGLASNNTVRERQSILFRGSKALILAYDNYQRGLSLPNQRGKHSSAFFKGTHQCAHKVIPFTDCTFDEMHASFTLHDQDIPSPWGMPAFELADLENPSDFFVQYENFNTVVTPDFSGERVRGKQLEKESIHIVFVHSFYTKHSFPPVS